MKVWMTTSEWAEARLPGFPKTRQGMDALIAREAWAERSSLARPRPGRVGGGGTEYHVENAPLSVRVALAARYFHIDDSDLRPTITDGDGLTATARETRDARLVLLRLADRFRGDQGLSIAAADTLFAGLFNARSIDLPTWVTNRFETISARSLARWRAKRDAAPDALGFDPAQARRGTGQLDRALNGRVKTFILAAIAKQPFLAAKHVRALVDETFGGEIAVPPLRTFQRSLKVWREAHRNELLYLTDPDGYRSKVQFALVNGVQASRLNEWWQIDASPVDVMLTEGRHNIYMAIDVFSRRTKLLTTKTPRASGVGLLTRNALIAWGVPENVKVDNGSDFKAHATQRLFSALCIEVDYSNPYNPQEKGMVERVIGTFQRDCAVLPGFIGHSVADRKVIEGRKAFAQRMGADERELFEVDMDLAEFQAWCDDWTDTIYAHTEHEGIGRRTPFDQAASYTGTITRIDKPAALDVLLAPVPGRDGMRKVTKTGIRIYGAHYLTGSVMPGETVFCRMDPLDMGRVMLFAPDGEVFLGEAVCPELAGLDPAATIAAVKAEQKARLKDGIADIRREMRKIGPRAVADAMRNQAARKAENLVAFPHRHAPLRSDKLDAADDATRVVDPGAALSDRAAELHKTMVAEVSSTGTPDASSSAQVTRLPETREKRFRRALDLERRHAAGEELTDTDLLWLGGYQVTSEYRAMRAMLDDFGEAAIRPDSR